MPRSKGKDFIKQGNTTITRVHPSLYTTAMVEYTLLILRAEKLRICQPPEFYVTVTDGSRNESKSSIARGTTPKWNFKSKISANSNPGNFTIKIFWRYDRKEELMGQCNVSLPELLQQQGTSKSVPLELQLKNKISGLVFVQLSADREATALPVPPVPPVQTRTSASQNKKNSQATGTSARNTPTPNKPSGQLSVQPSKKRAIALPIPPDLPVQTRSPTSQNRKDRQAVETNARNISTHYHVNMHGGIGGPGGGGGGQGGSGGHGEGPQLILKGKKIWVNNDNAASKFFQCV
ncbi:hypothetical protein MVEN_00972300 [Mycena venus]|uniref:C2 domain-containing protein n=1 Tax=Mycena venus TaxID=2733690 RepID=A0A8H7D1W6_9AGAR|nr:hypothetical protein MVEN_00972300 [Mycena venus]